MLRVMQRMPCRDLVRRECRAQGTDAVLLVRQGDNADAVERAEMRVAPVVRGCGPEPLRRRFWCADGVMYGLFDGHEDVRSGREEREAFGNVVLDPG